MVNREVEEPSSATGMTVPIGPDTNESDAAKILEQELADLIRLAQP